jgi:hypothetical protein
MLHVLQNNLKIQGQSGYCSKNRTHTRFLSVNSDSRLFLSRNLLKTKILRKINKIFINDMQNIRIRNYFYR